MSIHTDPTCVLCTVCTSQWEERMLLSLWTLERFSRMLIAKRCASATQVKTKCPILFVVKTEGDRECETTNKDRSLCNKMEILSQSMDIKYLNMEPFLTRDQCELSSKVKYIYVHKTHNVNFKIKVCN